MFTDTMQMTPIHFTMNSNLVDNEIPSISIEERMAKAIKPKMRNDIVRSCCGPFFLKLSDCEDIMISLSSEMMKSLKNIEKSKMDLRMINSHISRLPTGKESGRFLAIDFLGACYRIAIVSFSASYQKPIIDVNTYFLPKQLTSCSEHEFFDFLARMVSDFLQSRGLSHLMWNACFSFPFALKHESLSRAQICSWSKEFNIRLVYGEDIVRLLQKALKKLKLKIQFHAVINDSVSVLVSCALYDCACSMSLIVGDGVNSAYMELISNVRRDETFEENEKYVIINTELAGLGDGGCLKKYITNFDRRLDRMTSSPGSHTFEKFISSFYIGETARQILLYLTEKKQLFNGNWPQALKQPYSFPTRYMCEIDRDPPHLFYSTEFIFREDLKIRNLKLDDLKIVRYVCTAVIFRSACMAASGAACILNRMQRSRVTIGIDGYLFKFHPNYSNFVTAMMSRLVSKKCTFRLRMSEGTNGIGSAAVVATYKKEDESVSNDPRFVNSQKQNVY